MAEANCSGATLVALQVTDGKLAVLCVRDHTGYFTAPMETRDGRERRSVAASRAADEELHVAVSPDDLINPDLWSLTPVEFSTRAGKTRNNAVFISRGPLPAVAEYTSEEFDRRAKRAEDEDMPWCYRECTAMTPVPVSELLGASLAARRVTASCGTRVDLRFEFVNVLQHAGVRARLQSAVDAFAAAAAAGSAPGASIPAAVEEPSPAASVAAGSGQLAPSDSSTAAASTYMDRDSDSDFEDDHDAAGSAAGGRSFHYDWHDDSEMRSYGSPEPMHLVAQREVTVASVSLDGSGDAGALVASASAAGAPTSAASSSSTRTFRLYLGDARSARSLEYLRAHGITHVVNCCCSDYPREFWRPHRKAGIRYATINTDDGMSYASIVRTQDPGAQWPAAMALLAEALSQGSSALVHCRMGMNRSATTAGIFAVLYGFAPSFEHAVREMQRVRRVVSPMKAYRDLAQRYLAAHATAGLSVAAATDAAASKGKWAGRKVGGRGASKTAHGGARAGASAMPVAPVPSVMGMHSELTSHGRHTKAE